MPPSMETKHILNEEIEDEDSFFDLVIKSDYNVINVVHAKASNPISPLTPSPKLKVFILGFKKQSKPDSKVSSSSVFNKNNSLRTQMLENTNFDVVSSMKPVPRYLKLIKPFYSKSFSKKAKVTPSCSPNLSTPGRLSEGSSSSSRKGSFKFVANKLVKSRSTSAVGGTTPVPELRRRDDTLLEKHDGIQGAILHCKKSYTCHDQKRFSI